jgi:predicted Zn-dependent peptidase
MNKIGYASEMTKQLVPRRKILPNGITLIEFPRSQKMTAQLSVVVKYGSNSDSEKKAGLAHFLEHMLAGGSKERTSLSRSIERSGGYVNLFTNHEFTMAIVDVLPKKLHEASKILLKLYFDNGFEQNKFDLEKKVILNEIAESSDNPWNLTDDLLRKNLYKTHPIRHPILGYHRTVSRLSIDDLEETYKLQYIPQNIILIFSGKFSNADVESIVQDFMEIKKSKIKLRKHKHTEKEEPKRLSRKTKKGICQTYLNIGHRTVSATHPDHPTLEIFSTIIGNGASSRLFRELREKRALTYQIQSSNCNGSDFGFFSIACATKINKLKETTDIILKEIQVLKNEGVFQDELLKGKNMLIGDLFRASDDSLTLHEGLASNEILFKDEYSFPKYLEKIKLVTADDVVEVVNKYLSENDFSRIVLTPEKID